MRKSLIRGAALAVGVLSVLASGAADAASLRVSPVTIERIAPAAAATLTLTNTGDRPINVQIRVFRWRQVDGIDTWERTGDVVASPPATRVAPGVPHTVRVVRVTRRAPAAEEAYRVVIDELPDPRDQRPQTVRMVLRYSIPVFFAPAKVKPAATSARLAYDGRQFRLAIANNGPTRVKVADVTFRDSAGVTHRLADGLLGYVLSGSAMSWPLPHRGRPPAAGPGVVRIASGGAVTDVPVTLPTR